MDDPPPTEPQPEPEGAPARTSHDVKETEEIIEVTLTRTKKGEPADERPTDGQLTEVEPTEPVEVDEEDEATPPDWKGLLEVNLPLAVTDELFNIVQPSRKLMELTAYAQEELVGVPAVMLLDEDDREVMLQRVRSLAGPEGDTETGQVLSMETRLLAQTGETHKVQLSVLTLHFEEATRHLMLFDLAEGQGAQETVRPLLDVGPLPVPMVLVNDRGRISYLNPVACEVLGFVEGEEAIGRPFATLLVEERDLRPFQRLLEVRGEVTAYQLRLHTRHGNQFVTEVTAGALMDGAGLPAGFLALFKDITGEVLKASEDLSQDHQYQELVAGAPVGLALLDHDHRFRSVNPALARMMGGTEEDLVRKRIGELVQPAQAERLEAELDRLLILSDAPTVTVEVEGRRKDGATLPLTLQLATVPKAHGAVVIFQDSTTQRAAIEQVKALEERYRELFENYDQTMVLADDDGYVVDANKVACDIFGLTKEEVIGRHIDEVLSEYGGSQGREALTGETPGTSGTPGTTGTVAPGAPSLSDISRQELERLIREEKLAALGHLVAGVAHHINNPLAFVRAYTNSMPEYLDSLEELLRAHDQLVKAAQDSKEVAVVKALGVVDKAKEETQVKELFTHLRKQMKTSLEGLDRIASVTEKLRAYARPDTGPPQSADVCEGLQMALDLVRPHFGEGVVIDEKLDVVPPTLCQPTLLNQVFQALLMNAAQAFGETGKGRVTVVCKANVRDIVVEVTDNGPGMPERMLRNIFNPLFTTRHEGVGLGLTIAYWIVQLHDGSIEVESEVGKGTTFIVRLPIRTPDGRAESGQPPADT